MDNQSSKKRELIEEFLGRSLTDEEQKKIVDIKSDAELLEFILRIRLSYGDKMRKKMAKRLLTSISVLGSILYPD